MSTPSPATPPSPAPQARAPGFAQGLVTGSLATAVVCGALALWWRWPQPAPVLVVPPPTPAPFVEPTAAPIAVHISGAVNAPGLYTLAGDGRVADALAAAGGASANADESQLNLAQRLGDGQRLHVPLVGEIAPTLEPSDTGSRTESVDLPATPINLNRATLEELLALPGVGEKTAEAIMAARPFASVEALDAVPGIGDVTMAKLRPLVTAP